MRRADREKRRFGGWDARLVVHVHAFWVDEREIWHLGGGEARGVETGVERVRGGVGVRGAVRRVEDRWDGRDDKC